MKSPSSHAALGAQPCLGGDEDSAKGVFLAGAVSFTFWRRGHRGPGFTLGRGGPHVHLFAHILSASALIPVTDHRQLCGRSSDLPLGRHGHICRCEPLAETRPGGEELRPLLVPGPGTWRRRELPASAAYPPGDPLVEGSPLPAELKKMPARGVAHRWLSTSTCRRRESHLPCRGGPRARVRHQAVVVTLFLL